MVEGGARAGGGVPLHVQQQRAYLPTLTAADGEVHQITPNVKDRDTGLPQN
jgi:hypothetical protein